MCLCLSWKAICVLLNRARLLITVHQWQFSVSQDNLTKLSQYFLKSKSQWSNSNEKYISTTNTMFEIIYPLMWYLSRKENTTEQFWFLCGILNLLMALCVKATWHLPKLLFILAGSSNLSFPNEDQLICRVVLVPLTQSCLGENSISLPHLYPEVLSGFLHLVYSCAVQSKNPQSLPMWNDINLFSEH